MTASFNVTYSPKTAGTVELGAASLAALENISVTVTSIGEVEVKNDSGSPIPVSGTVTANAGTNLNTSLLALEAGGNLAGAATSLAVIDDWDESDRAKVNVVVGQAGITAGAGAVAANTPRVTHASDDPVTTALQIMDDWDESDRAKVNPIAGQAGVQGASGTVNALTQRVVLATDVALPAGTNIIGALSANQSVNTAQMNGVAVTMGNGASGTGVQRVTLADNSTGNIATIGTSVTPGTAAANLGKARGGTAGSTDTGVLALAVRQDAAAALNSDGQNVPATTDKYGGPYPGIRRTSTSLSTLNTTYDDSPTTVTSATVDCTTGRQGIFFADVTITLVPTDITFTLEMSDDGSTWEPYREGPWCLLRWDDATVAAYPSGTLKIAQPFFIIASNCRIVVTCTGTDATNKFTVANARVQVVN